VKVPAKIAITIVLSSITQCIAGVSAVSGHVQSIFVGHLLVVNPERRIFGRVPEVRGPLPHLNSQLVRPVTRQEVDSLEAEPEVAVNRSKAGFVVSPSALPAGVAGSLMNDDPTEYRLDWYST